MFQLLQKKLALLPVVKLSMLRMPDKILVTVQPGFKFRKLYTPFESFDWTGKYDLVYHDTFDPNAQPEFCENPFVKNVASVMNCGAILVSYSSKGTYRRALEACGLKVKKIPGPPGKREITRARKIC